MHWREVPNWIAAIGTSGSLLLGLSIIRKDRKDALEAQARRVGYRLVSDIRKDELTGIYRTVSYSLNLHNRSDEAFFNLNTVEIFEIPVVGRRWSDIRKYRGELLAKRETLDERHKSAANNKLEELDILLMTGRLQRGSALIEELDAGERVLMSGQYLANKDWSRLILAFSDMHGRTWLKLVKTGELRPFNAPLSRRARNLFVAPTRRLAASIRWRLHGLGK